MAPTPCRTTDALQCLWSPLLFLVARGAVVSPDLTLPMDRVVIAASEIKCRVGRRSLGATTGDYKLSLDPKRRIRSNFPEQPSMSCAGSRSSFVEEEREAARVLCPMKTQGVGLETNRSSSRRHSDPSPYPLPYRERSLCHPSIQEYLCGPLPYHQRRKSIACVLDLNATKPL